MLAPWFAAIVLAALVQLWASRFSPVAAPGLLVRFLAFFFQSVGLVFACILVLGCLLCWPVFGCFSLQVLAFGLVAAVLFRFLVPCFCVERRRSEVGFGLQRWPFFLVAQLVPAPVSFLRFPFSAVFLGPFFLACSCSFLTVHCWPFSLGWPRPSSFALFSSPASAQVLLFLCCLRLASLKACLSNSVGRLWPLL